MTQACLLDKPTPPATRPPPRARAVAAASALSSPVVLTSALTSPGRESRLRSSHWNLLPNPAWAGRLELLLLAPWLQLVSRPLLWPVPADLDLTADEVSDLLVAVSQGVHRIRSPFFKDFERDFFRPYIPDPNLTKKIREGPKYG